MAAKNTFSVRLEDDQLQQLEARSATIGLSIGHLIRGAIKNSLEEQEERDYLLDIEARMVGAINRLARQVEKDRAEQQLVVGVLDGIREWLAFTLPTPPDKEAANELMLERNRIFLERLPHLFTSYSKAKITEYMQIKDRQGQTCPKCGIGRLKCREGKKGLFWYCTNWYETPKCKAIFSDRGGQPFIPAAESDEK